MTFYTPFGEGSADYARASVAEAIARLEPITSTVSQGNPDLVARLLDPRPIGAAEWTAIERNI